MYANTFTKTLFIVFIVALTSTTKGQLSWTQVPTPDTSATRNILRGISGTSSSDVWVVGSFEERPPAPPYYVQKDLIMHWDGQSWRTFPPMNLSTTLDDLWDVAAVSTTDVWAVGNYNDPAVKAELLHYDGNSWSHKPLPDITGGSFLYGIDANSANDIWAAGGKFASPTRLAYTIHYNGSSWTEIAVPPVGIYWNAFNSINGVASNDMWAGGYKGEHYGDFHALLMHWNGSTWTDFPLPTVSQELGEILDVRMINANDGWATGNYLTGGAFKLHWNGTAWKEIIPGNGGYGAFAGIATNNVFSFGGEISHWDGSSWTVVDSLNGLSYPSLSSAITFSNGDIWAAGRTVDLNNNFYSLVYRSVNTQPLFARGTDQSVMATPGTNSIDTLLRVHDADISQFLRYTLTSTPMHGSIVGLPTTAITSNGFAQPSGIQYIPDPGFTGADQFTVMVTVGKLSAATTIHVAAGSVLAVHLTNFSVMQEDDHVKLLWSTSSENSLSAFQVEKSADGVTFQPLTTIFAAGSNSGAQYNTTDSQPVSGNNFYRLKIIDTNSGSTYSEVKQLFFAWQHPEKFSILENPVKGKQIKITSPEGTFDINLFTLDGKKVFQTKTTTSGQQTQISLPAGISQGIYFLIISNHRKRFAKKIIIQ